MYERTKVLFHNSIEIMEKHTGRYGAPGMKRAERKKPTPEQMAKQNQWKKERDIRWLLKANFGEHDYWTTLTYKPGERPVNIEIAKVQVQKFLRQMKSWYKKQESNLKYIVITEYGSRGGVHHHIVMNRIPGTDIEVAQKWPYGKPSFSLLYLEGDFRKLASYIAKQPSEENAIKDKWYSRSRNLQKPEMEKRIMRRKTFSQEPFVPKGYYLEKESLYSGINPITGHPYRYYTVIKINRRC